MKKWNIAVLLFTGSFYADCKKRTVIPASNDEAVVFSKREQRSSAMLRSVCRPGVQKPYNSPLSLFGRHSESRSVCV